MKLSLLSNWAEPRDWEGAGEELFVQDVVVK